ncbi:MAG: hypothetical protein IKO48_07200 [Elusimicrobia bacterium]|nr:hypothetical protein [Elusimicrobiota bacterium]
MTEKERVVLHEMLNKEEGTVLISFLEEKKKQAMNKMLSFDDSNKIFAEYSKVKTYNLVILELLSIKKINNQSKETENNE